MAGLMPKVFEEANLSGELKLSGRKLKDFPKTAAKYNLSDTVIAGMLLNCFNCVRYLNNSIFLFALKKLNNKNVLFSFSLNSNNFQIGGVVFYLLHVVPK